MRNKRGKKGPGQRAPHWMITYADMVTLLMCFFVLLTAISKVEVEKFRKVMGALKGALGVLEPTRGPVVYEPEFADIQRRNLVEALIQLKEYLKSEGLEQAVSVEFMEEGAHIRISNPLLFDLGKANLKSTVLPVLKQLARIARDMPYELQVEGHTCDLPIHTSQFPSNWELSAARALNVVKYLAYHEGVDPARLSAVGYGEYRPIAPNDSKENRAKNRRAEIYIKRWKGLPYLDPSERRIKYRDNGEGD